MIIRHCLNDSELVSECLRGNHDAQKCLYERFAPKMLGVAYRYASSREEAEDFLQEAFITIFRKLKQWKGEGPLGAWIRRIVVNTSLNCLKSKHRFTEESSVIPIDQIPDSSVLHHNASDSELMELVHQLPVGCKTVFNLFAIEGYTHDEIAAMLDIKAGTSRSQYMKARQMLMKKLGRDFGQSMNDKQHG